MTDSARDAFTYFDVDVSALSDDQCDQAADLILSRFGGLTPDIKQIKAVVDEVREGVVPSDALAGRNETRDGTDVDAGEDGTLVGGPQQDASALGSGSPIGVQRASSPVSSVHPVSTRCSSCTPRWSVSPSGGGFFHERSCLLKPNQKIYRPSTEAKQRQRMVASHRAEDARTGMVFTGRVSPCEKCGTPTSRGVYCKDCKALLTLIRGSG